MKTLVTESNLDEVLEDLTDESYIGLDTETYGLDIEDDMFSLQLSTRKSAYYFNFHDYNDGTHIWDRHQALNLLDPVWEDHKRVLFIHNAKFDLHKLLNYALWPMCKIHCTMAVERLIYNQYMNYGLDACLRRRGLKKNGEVDAYIVEHKLYEWVTVEGRKRRDKNKFYDQVPFDIMFGYGCEDASDVRYLGMDQLKNLHSQEVYDRECRLVKACLNMERVGVCIDKDYIEHGKRYEEGRLHKAKAEATSIAESEFVNGPKWLRAAFDKVGQEYAINPDTGNPVFDKRALGKMSSPLAGVVKNIRQHEKYIGTYYSAFKHYGKRGVIHANIRQAGTDTGRFSYSNPNLQNVPKEEDFKLGAVQVRKCLVPRPDFCFVPIDFDQQEFRLMLDYAGETQLINNIMADGLDVHQATADMVDITRKNAKTLNFALLYGMGVATLAKSLDISEFEATDLRDLYFSKLPRVRQLINSVQAKAKGRGYIKTWAGRRLHFKHDEVYKAPNHLIQGGCGDIAKEAMNRLDAYLIGKRSNMLIQVHDEIVFEVHKDELDIVHDLRVMMEDVYEPEHGMKLTCGVEHSWVSWGKQDMNDGTP